VTAKDRSCHYFCPATLRPTKYRRHMKNLRRPAFASRPPCRSCIRPAGSHGPSPRVAERNNPPFRCSAGSDTLFKQPMGRNAFALAARGARGFPETFRPETEGVGNAGCPVAPAASRAENGHHAHEYSQRGTGKHPAFPHAMVLTVYTRSPRR